MTEIDEVELIKKHYGDFTGLYDPAQAVAHVKILLAEVLDHRALFDLQWKRSREADELWRQEDPVARANVHPDLGVLLAWLMAQIEGHRVRAEAANNLHANAEHLLTEARRERDLAIAHDRQPYPTAWAYEQACKTIERMRPVVVTASALREAQSASPYLGAPPELVELIAAVDAYESEMEAIAAANRPGGNAPTAAAGRKLPVCVQCGHRHRWGGECADHSWGDSCPYDAGADCELGAPAQSKPDVAPVDAALDGDRPASSCCDFHNVHCEPPSELCCGFCGEVEHPNHARGVVCVLEAARAAEGSGS